MEENDCLLPNKIERNDSESRVKDTAEDQTKTTPNISKTFKDLQRCKSVGSSIGVEVDSRILKSKSTLSCGGQTQQSPKKSNDILPTEEVNESYQLATKSCTNLAKIKTALSKSSPLITVNKYDSCDHQCDKASLTGEVIVVNVPLAHAFHDQQSIIGPHQVIYPQRSYETSQGSESVICRICHSSGDDRLIAPCKCAGSTRYVHASCLVTWFKKSVKHQCELCRSDVKIRKINHNISLWRKPEDRPIPLIWFSVFFIGLFLNILSIYVNASESCDSTACLIFYVVNGFGIILDAAFLWFWFLKCKHYWKKWCALNQDWFIDDLDEERELSVEYVRNNSDEAFV